MSAERPKRPLSSYMLWFQANREKIKQELPDANVKDIARRGGELWRALNDDARQEWDNKARVLRVNYLEAVAKYEENGGTDAGAVKKRKKVKKPLAEQEQEQEDENSQTDELKENISNEIESN